MQNFTIFMNLMLLIFFINVGYLISHLFLPETFAIITSLVFGVFMKYNVHYSFDSGS